MCIVCYVIPVALHLKLYLSKSGYQLLEAAESPSLAEPLLQVLLPLPSRTRAQQSCTGLQTIACRAAQLVCPRMCASVL